MAMAVAALAACGGGSGAGTGGSGGREPPGDPAPSVVLLTPNGGEFWEIASAQLVAWSSENFTDSVDVDLSTDGGATWSSLLAGTPNDGEESITVPPVPTHQAVLRVGRPD